MKEKKVLFYTFTPRMFRSVLIGHLYSICREWPTVLVSEKLDSKTEKILQNKKLFPNLQKIAPISQFTGGIKKNPFSQNKYLCGLAKKLIRDEKPDLVISASDMNSLFDMYLMRFAKKNGAMVICFQSGVAADSQITGKWVELSNAHQRFPNFFPLTARIFLQKCRKHIGHFFYHWILPLSIGQMPLTGKSSYILWKGIEGMRQADWQVVFSKRDFEIYQKAGVLKEKLKILQHPLAIKKSYDFFKKEFLKPNKSRKKTVLILIPVKAGFKKKDWSVISEADRFDIWLKIIKLVKENLPQWQIMVSCHPDAKIEEIEKEINDIPTLINKDEPVDLLIEKADLIIGLPRSASTVLFTASLQCPEKPVVSLDFQDEILGDFYKDFRGIKYINNRERFVDFLKKADKKSFKKSGKNAKLADYGTLDLLKEILKNDS